MNPLLKSIRVCQIEDDIKVVYNSTILYYTMLADAWRILGANCFTGKTHDPSKCVKLLE